VQEIKDWIVNTWTGFWSVERTWWAVTLFWAFFFGVIGFYLRAEYDGGWAPKEGATIAALAAIVTVVWRLLRRS
jgi:hypothetical protein